MHSDLGAHISWCLLRQKNLIQKGRAHSLGKMVISTLPSSLTSRKIKLVDAKGHSHRRAVSAAFGLVTHLDRDPAVKGEGS